MEKIYHHYKKWEDYKNGLYSVPPQEDHCRLISQSIVLLSDPFKLKEAMQGVVDNWKMSTEHNMTDVTINRRAWLGQSACCYNHGASSDLVKEAWHQLSENTQALANNVATKIIKEFERKLLLQQRSMDRKAEFGLIPFEYA